MTFDQMQSSVYGGKLPVTYTILDTKLDYESLWAPCLFILL